MPLKILKQDTADALTLEWVLQVKNYKLTIDKNRCVGCQICSLACPKEAIKTEKQPKIQGQKTKKAKVDVDLAKCTFCGICDVSCPYGAIKVTLNGTHDLSILEKESYPQLIPDVNIDNRLCEKECVDCETACPLSLIKISKIGFDGNPIENVAELSPTAKKQSRLTLTFKKIIVQPAKYAIKCNPGAIKVNKAIEGKIGINQEKCPKGSKTA